MLKNATHGLESNSRPHDCEWAECSNHLDTHFHNEAVNTADKNVLRLVIMLNTIEIKTTNIILRLRTFSSHSRYPIKGKNNSDMDNNKILIVLIIVIAKILIWIVKLVYHNPPSEIQAIIDNSKDWNGAAYLNGNHLASNPTQISRCNNKSSKLLCQRCVVCFNSPIGLDIVLHIAADFFRFLDKHFLVSRSCIYKLDIQ